MSVRSDACHDATTTSAQRDPVVLGPDHGLTVEQAIRDTGETRNWTLHALNARTNHVCTAHDFMVGLGNNPKQPHLSSFRMADNARTNCTWGNRRYRPDQYSRSQPAHAKSGER